MQHPLYNTIISPGILKNMCAEREHGGAGGILVVPQNVSIGRR